MERRNHALNQARAAVFNNNAAVSNQVGIQNISGPVTYNTTHVSPYTTDNQDETNTIERRSRFHDSLRFSQLEARYQTIEQAHFKTCEWILTRPEYTSWLRDDMLSEHQGLLWIKGKPGVGKSTLMKFAYTHTMQQQNDTVILAFFFNARGDELEKSTKGMYRSFTYHILRKIPELLSVFDSLCPGKDDMISADWDTALLVDLFIRVVKSLGDRKIICFVDALDECAEEQVRHMVSVFEHLCRTATISKTPFRICLSSRHYPQITIPFGKTLVLEDQKEHDNDITEYLETKLYIGSSENARQVKQELIKRASGVFLWVVLVTKILCKEYDRGQMRALHKRLSEIPNDLKTLLDDILTRDGLPGAEFISCVQWVLYARRPLQPQELYFAIQAEIEPGLNLPWNPDEISIADIRRYFVACCRGLIELTKAKEPTVQFIHESVTDYFLTRHSEFGEVSAFAAADSHNRLKLCCQAYCSDVLAYRRGTLADADFREVTAKHPFLQYAVDELFYHSEMALKHGSNQDAFLKNISFQNWLKSTVFLRSMYPRNVSLLWVLATKDLTLLTEQVYMRDRRMTAGRLCSEKTSPLKAAQLKANADTIELFLTPDEDDPPSIVRDRAGRSPNPIDISNAVDYLSHMRATNVTLLTEAAYHGSLSTVKCILSGGWHEGSYDLASALYAAAGEGHKTLVRFLLDAGAEVNMQVGRLGSALCTASASRKQGVVHILLDAGADVNMKVELLGSALCAASAAGDSQIAQVLIDAGADVNVEDGQRGNALYIAASFGFPKVVKTLLRAGADVNANSNGRGTAYQAASVFGEKEVMNILENAGANDAVNLR